LNNWFTDNTYIESVTTVAGENDTLIVTVVLKEIVSSGANVFVRLKVSR